MSKIVLCSLMIMFLGGILGAQGIEFVHPTVMDKGKVSQGDVISGDIVFVNTGSEVLELDRVKASCGCTTVDPEVKSFSPGDTAVIPYTVETKNFSGVIRKNIKLYFKNIEPETQMVVVQANVVTDLAINPRFVNFKGVTVNPDTTLSEYFEIENSSDKDIEIKSISSTADFLKIFPANTVIPAGKSHLIRLEFTPGNVGRHNTRIQIDADHPLQSSMNLPVFINVEKES